MIFETLAYIGQKLNDNKITWAVGASIVLNHYGLVAHPNDIDVLINIKDIKRADEILRNMGEKKSSEKVSSFSTKFFYEYAINNVDIDVMAGLTINHCCGKYTYLFDEKSIQDTEVINGVRIPYTTLEDWYVIYQLIPNREAKVKLIENWLTTNRITRFDLLERSLGLNLPSAVRKNIENLIALKTI